MRQGVLIYDQNTDRMDIRFGLEDYYGGLHCGRHAGSVREEQMDPHKNRTVSRLVFSGN